MDAAGQVTRIATDMSWNGLKEGIRLPVDALNGASKAMAA